MLSRAGPTRVADCKLRFVSSICRCVPDKTESRLWVVAAERIVVAGGSGFLGRALVEELNRDNTEVVILTRSPRATSDPMRLDVRWDGATLDAWASELDGARAVVNLTGRNVDCRHTKANRRRILESRVDSVRVIGEAIARAKDPPSVWVQASALAIYGDPTEETDEDSPQGEGFLADVCKEWEREFNESVTPDTRKVALRIGLVIGPGGGALPRLSGPARVWLGGTVGRGDQYVSWLHIADLNAIIRAAIEHESYRGVYNATAPTPVPNREFMRALRSALGRRWGLPMPSAAVQVGTVFMRTEASLALTGRRCVPQRLAEQGFQFQWRELEPALRDVLAQQR